MLRQDRPIDQTRMQFARAVDGNGANQAAAPASAGNMITAGKFLRIQNRRAGLNTTTGLHCPKWVAVDWPTVHARAQGLTPTVQYQGTSWTLNAPGAMLDNPQLGDVFFLAGENPAAVIVSNTVQTIKVLYAAEGAGSPPGAAYAILAGLETEELGRLIELFDGCKELLLLMAKISGKTAADITDFIADGIFGAPSTLGIIEMLVAIAESIVDDNLIGPIRNVAEAWEALQRVRDFIALLEITTERNRAQPISPVPTTYAPAQITPSAESEIEFGCFKRNEIEELRKHGIGELSVAKEKLLVKFVRKFRTVAGGGGGGATNFEIEVLLQPTIGALQSTFGLRLPLELVVKLTGIEYTESTLEEINYALGNRGLNTIQDLKEVFDCFRKFDLVTGRRRFLNACAVIDSLKASHAGEALWRDVPFGQFKRIIGRSLMDHKERTLSALFDPSDAPRDRHPAMDDHSQTVRSMMDALYVLSFANAGGGGAFETRKRDAVAEANVTTDGTHKRPAWTGSDMQAGSGGGSGKYGGGGRQEERIAAEVATVIGSAAAGVGGGTGGLFATCWQYLLGDECKKGSNCDKLHIRGVPGVHQCPYKEKCYRGKSCPLAASHSET